MRKFLAITLVIVGMGKQALGASLSQPVAVTNSPAVSQNGDWSVNATETNSLAIKNSLDAIDNAVNGNALNVITTESAKTAWSNYEANNSLAASGNDADLGTVTLSVDTKLQSVKFTAAGSARAVLVINGVNKAELVTSPSCRADSIVFNTPLSISAGQYICLDVTNEDDVNAQRVSVTFVGYQP